MRLLAFRLQLESGVAKLASGDPTWRDLSACRYHQETQPLPTPAGWLAHHLPRRAQTAATALTLFVECVVPFLVLGPRRLRQAAFGLLTGFQGLIALTGNYAFFNWLTVVINLSLLERPVRRPLPGTGGRTVRRVRAFIDAAAAAPILVLSLSDIAERLRPRLRRLESVDRVAGALAPFHVVSSYGLFSVMTTARRRL